MTTLSVFTIDHKNLEKKTIGHIIWTVRLVVSDYIVPLRNFGTLCSLSREKVSADPFLVISNCALLLRSFSNAFPNVITKF